MTAPTYNFAYLDEGTKRMIRRAILKGIAMPGYQVPFASREMPMPYGWGTGGVQVTAAILGPADVLKVIDQGADDTTNAVSIRAFFQKTAGVATTTRTARGHDRPDAPPHPRDAAAGRPDHRLPGADPRAAALPRAARDRDPHHARARRIRPDARQALRGHRPPRPYRHHLRLSGEGRGPLRHGPLAAAEIRQSQDAPLAGPAALRRRPREAHLCAAALHRRAQPRFRGPSLRGAALHAALRALRRPRRLSRRGRHRRPGRAHVRLLRHRPLRGRAGPRATAAMACRRRQPAEAAR